MIFIRTPALPDSGTESTTFQAGSKSLGSVGSIFLWRALQQFHIGSDKPTCLAGGVAAFVGGWPAAMATNAFVAAD